MTPQSVLQLYSVAKPVTALAVMQLAEQGVISLDAPLTDSLPGFEMADPRFAKITIRMLLEHRSGVPTEPNVVYVPADQITTPLEAMVLGLRYTMLYDDPGTRWRYTSSGYSLLGAVLEATSGQSFPAYMQEHWFEPLGMAHSTFAT
jgi:CubicO group peptidase (beta-lactamase class C family)